MGQVAGTTVNDPVNEVGTKDGVDVQDVNEVLVAPPSGEMDGENAE